MKSYIALSVVVFAIFFFSACGDDSSTSNDSGKLSNADMEVDSFRQMPQCAEKNDGQTAYVVDQDQGYICKDGEWVEDDGTVEIASSSSSKVKGSSSSVKFSSSSGTESVDSVTIDSTLRKCAPEFDNKYMTYDNVTFRCYDDFWRPEKDPPKDTEAQVICLKTTDPNAPLKCYLDTAIWSSSSYAVDPDDFVDQGVITIKDGSITGVAQKGPYLQGSTYRIIPLDGKTLKPTGDTLSDQFNNSKGTYTFCDLNLPSQYAMIEASGYYRSELTGNKSNLQMTIGAIVDVQKGANINMITNLEYERVKYLVQNENYNIAGAKKRALTEVLSAFHIENVTGSAEQLDITQNGEANGALLAISIMIQGVAGSEFNVIDMMEDFREDLKEDGQWTGKAARTKIADIAYAADNGGKLGGYRQNVASWGLSGVVPAFEQYVNDFWATEYGIGKCSVERKDIIKKNQNSASAYKDEYFICENNHWRQISQFEYNTRNQVCDVDGLIIPGNIDKDKYYICKNGWREATSIEVDMYFTDCTQDGKLHLFSDGKTYKCSDDVFVKASSSDSSLGLGCVNYLDGETMVVPRGIYKYKCSRGSWTATKEWAVENCTKDGRIFGASNGKGYVCDADTFRVVTKADSLAQSYKGSVCVSYTEGNISNGKDAIYTYTCERGSWKKNDGWSMNNCTRDGSIQEMVYDDKGSKRKYVCSADSFRVANEADSSDYSFFGAVCVSYLEGQERETPLGSPVRCSNGIWTFAGTYGALEDPRDGKKYKTVAIGTQVWMAENLNYETANSFCYKNSAEYCAQYGRYYLWSDAMDSAGVWTMNGKGCGDNRTCSPVYPVRGVCPEGWHLPTETEFKTMFTAVGGQSMAGRMLKSVSGWNSRNGIDAFSFAAKPAGLRTSRDEYLLEVHFNEGNDAYFCSSSEIDSLHAYDVNLNSSDDSAYLNKGVKYNMYSVRCVKD